MAPSRLAWAPSRLKPQAVSFGTSDFVPAQPDTHQGHQNQIHHHVWSVRLSPSPQFIELLIVRMTTQRNVAFDALMFSTPRSYILPLFDWYPRN